MRWLVLLGWIAGCGRIGFDATGSTDGSAGIARSTLALDRVLPGSPLTGVPVPITLDATRADLAKLTPDTFHAFIGTTELPVEIESAGPPFVAWVRVPQISDLTTTITIEYGGASVAHTPVWDGDYAGVWHMMADGHDSSPSARASQITALAQSAGVIGPATTYSPALQSCIMVPSFETFSFTAATLSGWMFINATAAPEYYTIITRQLMDTINDDFIVGTDPSYQSLAAMETDTLGSPSRSGPPVSLGAWHFFAFAFGGGSSALYVDGVVVSSSAATGVPVTSPRPMFIGCGRNFATVPIEQSDGDWVDGAVDEVRFETVSRDSAWIAYQYAADKDGVITYGPVE